MYCCECEITDVVLFPIGNNQFKCANCIKLKPVEHEQIDSDKDYILKWKLKDENGKEYYEVHEGISLSDFEVIYSSNTNEVIWFTVRQKNRAII